MTEQGYDWRHGWVPLTMAAALQKAKGNRELAGQLLGEAREKRNRKRAARGHVEFRPPSAHHIERATWAGKTDDDLADELGAPDVDDATVERIVRELDRRDAAARKAEAQRARRAATRQTRDRAREARWDELLAEGMDPQTAYAEAYGVDEERVRRDEAILSLRGNGYSGKGFDQLVRAALTDHVEQSYTDAEDECRGHLLSKAGQARGVTPRSLFTGPEARARKYASEELLNYWQQNGRLTMDDFKASLLGGHMRSTSTAYFA